MAWQEAMRAYENGDMQQLYGRSEVRPHVGHTRHVVLRCRGGREPARCGARAGHDAIGEPSSCMSPLVTTALVVTVMMALVIVVVDGSDGDKSGDAGDGGDGDKSGDAGDGGHAQAWSPPEPVFDRADFAAVVEAKEASVGWLVDWLIG